MAELGLQFGEGAVLFPQEGQVHPIDAPTEVPAHEVLERLQATGDRLGVALCMFCVVYISPSCC